MSRSVSYAIYTDIGTRPVNEDAAKVFTDRERTFCALCDGLGGHGMGDTASWLAVQTMGEVFTKNQELPPQKLLKKAYTTAQERLLAKQKEFKATRRMKTTAVTLLCDGRTAYASHVGDSRFYAFRRNRVIYQSSDHSVPQMLVLSGEITKQEIRNHPDRSSLLRALGAEWKKDETEQEPPLPLRKCQAFLLCSDGFWELIEESDMERLLKDSSDVQNWLDQMALLVQKNGKGKPRDNQTAIAVWVNG